MVECKDKNCPVHGNLKVRGNVFKARVINAKGNTMVTVERKIIRKVPKYERYKKVKSRIKAHNPPCMNAKENDMVTIGETRKISKTKSFVVTEVERK
ncbi:MAG: 30S ribosomal protein S17 [archaeon]|nr:30S ribosomal protein S17 [Candidatus Micrarchaeota archaeon]